MSQQGSATCGVELTTANWNSLLEMSLTGVLDLWSDGDQKREVSIYLQYMNGATLMNQELLDTIEVGLVCMGFNNNLK